MADMTTISNEFLTATISPLGAELQALRSADGRDWLWDGDADWWSGRSPILFPIVGKAPGDQLTIDGATYPMNQHGFARKSAFTLLDAGLSFCRYELTANDETKAQYPFDFTLMLEHRLDGPSLSVSATVSNPGEKGLPFTIGYHPAFCWPLPGSEGHHHIVLLDNRAEPPFSRLEGGLRRPERLASPFSEGRLALDPRLFAEDAMIFPEGAGKGLSYGVDGGPMLHFTFENLPHLALWTKPGAPYLCIEPWHGTAPVAGTGDDIADRPGAMELAPGESQKFAFTVTLPL